MVEDECIITKHEDIAEVMNDHYTSVASNLNLPKIPKQDSGNLVFQNDIERIIHDYQSHPSIVAINEMCSDGDKFDFKKLAVRKCINTSTN